MIRQYNIQEGILAKTLKIKLCFFAFFLLVFIVAPSAGLRAAYVISSLDYELSPSSNKAKIGDNILINMVVVDTSQAYSDVSVTSSSSSQIVVTSPGFPDTYTGVIYVYDGTHTWEADNTKYNAATKEATLDNTNLLTNRTVADYTSLLYASFSAARGTLEPGGSATADIGTAVQGITLYDDGDISGHNDNTAGDGIYNCKFEVREAYQFSVVNGSIAGRFTAADSTEASNSPFITPRKISIDGIRPAVELADVRPNPFNPNKELLNVNYMITEDCDVTLTVKDSGGTIVKTADLDAYGGALELYLWDGLSDSGVIQTDGDYTYAFDITDRAGNTGAAYTGEIKITTVEVIVNIRTIDTEYTEGEEAQVLVKVEVETELRNASASNLENLDFDPAMWGAGSYKNYPWALVDLKLYDSGGSLLSDFPKDTTDCDEDIVYINPAYDPMGATDPDFDYPDGYDPAYPDYCSETAAPVIHSDPDGETGNDWNIVFGNSLTAVFPGVYRKTDTFVYHSDDIGGEGYYIVKAISVLVGKSVVNVSEEVEEVEDECTADTLFLYRYHAQPSFYLDETSNIITDFRGYGLASEQRTAMFYVEESSGVPTPDTEGPVIIPYSEYPSDGQTIDPEKLGPSNYLKVTLEDEGVGAGYENLSEFILKDPFGNPVSGQVAWNAGTPDTKQWEVYFIPDDSITLGGSYEYTVIPKDGAGNAGTSKTYNFSVRDMATPLITGVYVYSSSDKSKELSDSASTQITFQVSEIEASLIPGGTVAEVDWESSTISVKDEAGNSVKGMVSHASGTNILKFEPDTVLEDGAYTIYITAFSDAGESAAYAYNFYITTVGTTYVNISGTTTTAGTDTYMIVALLDETYTHTGITEGGGSEISPTAINVAEVSSVQTPPANLNILGTVVTFSVSAPYQLPLNFNPDFCEVTLRMHFSDSDLSNLMSMGLDQYDLGVYKFDGVSWSEMSNAGDPAQNSSDASDNYIEVALTEGASPEGVPSENQYALMYTPPAEAAVEHHFDNTKAFNPESGAAKIFYTSDVEFSEIEDVEFYVFSMRGALIRKLEMSDPAEAVYFNNYETNPVNSSETNYYISWDGKNGNNTAVRNGVYFIRAVIHKTGGSSETFSRLVAVIK